MNAEPARSRANTYTCIAVAALGFSISTLVILSLIPIYLEDTSTAKTRGRRSVNSLDDVHGTFPEASAELERPTPRRMYPPAGDQFDELLNGMEATCMVIRGTSEFDLRVKIYYDCKDTPLFVSRIQSIKEALRRMGGFTVQKRRTVSGRIILSLQSRADHWSESQEVNEPSRKGSSECIPIAGDEFNYRIIGLHSRAYDYYCFRWAVTNPQPNYQLSFDFDVTDGQSVLIDDIALISSTNLIDNGDFETPHSTAWSCGSQACRSNYVRDDSKPGEYSFRASDTLSLAQLVSPPTIDTADDYQFSFRLKFNCDEANPCSVTARLRSSVPSL